MEYDTLLSLYKRLKREEFIQKMKVYCEGCNICPDCGGDIDRPVWNGMGKCDCGLYYPYENLLPQAVLHHNNITDCY